MPLGKHILAPTDCKRNYLPDYKYNTKLACQTKEKSSASHNGQQSFKYAYEIKSLPLYHFSHRNVAVTVYSL